MANKIVALSHTKLKGQTPQYMPEDLYFLLQLYHPFCSNTSKYS